MTVNKGGTEPRLSAAFAKLMRYCAYRERCSSEVLDKAGKLGLAAADAAALLERLKEEGFVDDTRFAALYAAGKFRLKKWGKIKIRASLQLKQLSDEDIAFGLGEIDQRSYLSTLQTILEQKSGRVKESNHYVKNEKIARHAISKGYEPGLVWQALKELA